MLSGSKMPAIPFKMPTTNSASNNFQWSRNILSNNPGVVPYVGEWIKTTSREQVVELPHGQLVDVRDG